MGIFSKKENVAEATIKVGYDGKEAEKGLSSLKGTVKTVISAIAIKQIAGYTYEVSKLGAQAVLVEKNFAKFAESRNRSVDSMVSALTRASKGTVSTMNLQQQAMKAMIGGVKFDDLVTAMEYVTNYAISTGEDVNTKMQTVISGLARGSVLMLDDVGIQIKGTENVVGRAIDQMREKMGQFATTGDEVAVKASQMKKAYQDLAIQIGKDLQPAFEMFVSLATKTSTAIGKVLQDYKEYIDYSDRRKTGLPISEERTRESSLIAKLIKESKDVGDARDLVRKQSELIDQVLDIEKKYSDSVKKINDLNKSSGGKFSLFDKAVMKDERKKANELLYELSSLKQDKDAVNKAISEIKKPKKQGNGIEDTTTSVSEDTAKQAATISDKAHERYLQSTFEGRLKLLDEQYKKEKKLLQEAGKSTNELTKQYNIERNDMIVDQSVKNAELIRDIEASRVEDKREQFEDAKELENKLLESSYTNNLELRQRQYEEEYALLESFNMSTAELTKQYEEEMFQTKLSKGQEWLNASASIANSIQQLMSAGTNRELAELDKKKISERKYNKERERILKEQEQQERAFARVQQAIILGQTIMDIAKGTGTALKKGFFGIPELAFVAAQGALQIATIEAQHFSGGGLIGNMLSGSGADDTMINARRGEFVVNPSATAQNLDLLTAINSNTATTARGINGMKDGQTIINYSALPLEHLLQAQRQIERTGMTRREI